MLRFFLCFISFAQLIVAGVILFVANVAFCEEKAAEKKDEVAAEAKDGGPDKKQDKRGIYSEGYGDFGGDYGGGHGGWEHDDHHVHHHHEKTITVVKKVPQPYPVVKHVPVPVHKTVHYPVKVGVPQPYPGTIAYLNKTWFSFPHFQFLFQNINEIHFLNLPVVKHVPYTVKEYVKVPVHIPAPYPVEKTVSVRSIVIDCSFNFVVSNVNWLIIFFFIHRSTTQ